MAVNSGTLGTTISWSDLQAAYGGSHPISLSEYYRGGTEVPSTRTVTDLAADSDSGTASAGSGDNVIVTVTSVAGSDTFGPLVTTNPYTPSNGIINLRTLSFVTLRGGGRGNHSVVTYPQADGGGHPTSIFQVQQDDLNDFSLTIRGNAYQDGDSSGAFFRHLTGNGSIGFSGFGRNTDMQILATRTVTTGSTTYDLDIANRTGHTLNMTMSPWADDSSFTDDETDSADGQSSNSWSWSHPAVTSTENTNTNIPTSGVNNINQYNVPGTFSG